MPKGNFTTITVSTEIYNKIKKRLEEVNERAGYRKFRSIAHFVEEAIMKYNAEELNQNEKGN